MSRNDPQGTENAADWRSLTWDDLEAWSDRRSLERGRSYQRTKRVKQLARTGEGGLLAWVVGGQRYATQVEWKPRADGVKLFSRCTCPLRISGCKHAVAVVVQYLESLKNKTNVPEAAADDPRWELLDAADEGGREDEGFGEDRFEEDEFDEEEEESWDEERGTAAPRRSSRPRRKAGGKGKEARRAYLEGLPVAELANYILGLADDYPEVAKDLDARSAAVQGRTGDLVRQARKEIAHLTAQDVWVNSWSGEGNVPDYSPLRRLLEQLLVQGQADAVLELGERLFREGNDQVQQANDEGETATGIAGCLEVVFRALPASSRSDRDKLLFAIDMLLQDEYDLCEGAGEILDREWPRAVWSAVADELLRRLQSQGTRKGGGFSDNYHRDGLSGWAIECLRNAGREEEVLPLCEAEAPVTGSYQRLVGELLAADRLAEARRWALEGIEKTEATWPGIASQLRERLRELAEREKDWPAVAAFRAEEFFTHPSVHTLEILEQAADQAGCGEQVRTAAMHFLETGERPARAAAPATAVRPRGATSKRPGGKRAGAARPSGGPGWPLPEPYPATHRPREPVQETGPHLGVLLELALQQKRPDDVLKWYDRMKESRQSRGYYWEAGAYSGRVADAVAESHPDRAAAMYRRIAEQEIDRTSPAHYEAALPFLRKLRALLLRAGKEEEWTHYLAELREKNRRKRKLMEVLDRLEGRPILED
jgi:uncharacterized Zn finger protein